MASDYPQVSCLLSNVLLTFPHDEFDCDQVMKKGTPSDSLPRHPMPSAEKQTWMDKENAACNFRDERLKKRFRLLLKQFWTGMGQSIPFACQDWLVRKQLTVFGQRIR
jgi:hypothetical protein